MRYWMVCYNNQLSLLRPTLLQSLVFAVSLTKGADMTQRPQVIDAWCSYCTDLTVRVQMTNKEPNDFNCVKTGNILPAIITQKIFEDTNNYWRAVPCAVTWDCRHITAGISWKPTMQPNEQSQLISEWRRTSSVRIDIMLIEIKCSVSLANWQSIISIPPIQIKTGYKVPY